MKQRLLAIFTVGIFAFSPLVVQASFFSSITNNLFCFFNSNLCVTDEYSASTSIQERLYGAGAVAITALESKQESPSSFVEATKDKQPTIIQKITNPVVERIYNTREIVRESGLTQEQFNIALNELRKEIYSATTPASYGSVAPSVSNTWGLTQRIDKLSSVSFSDGTITGSPISGSSGSFTTLSASGATSLASTLSVTGATTLAGSLSLADTLADASGSSGTSGQVLTSTGTGTDWTTIPSASITDDSLDWIDFTDTMELDDTTTIDMDTNNADFNFDNNTLVIDSSANMVGVGTASPSVALDVRGNVLSTNGNGSVTLSGNSNSPGVVIDRLGVNNSAAVIYKTAGTSRWYAGLADSDLAGDGTEFYIGNGLTDNAKLWIETNGNVGIGTTAPDEKLSVAQDGSDVSTGAFAQLALSGTTDETKRLNLGYDSTNDHAFLQAVDVSSAWKDMEYFANSHKFKIGTSEKVTIDSSGNVGIGTTSPEGTLDIAGTSGIYVDNQQYIRNGDATGAADFYMDVSNLSIRRGDGAVAGAQLDVYGGAYISGNVGIGTASPGAKLHIAQGADYNGLRITGYDDESSDYLDLHVGGIMGRISTNKNYIYTQVAGSYVHRVNTSFFDLYTGLTMQDNKELRLGNDVDFRIQYDGTTDDRLEIADNALNQLLTIKDQGTKADFNFNNGDVFISSTGNVGIGTASPGTKLDVKGVDNSTIFTVQGASATVGQIGADASGDGYLYVKDSAGTTKIALDADSDSYFMNGNVGIGTTSPESLLNLYKSGAYSLTLSAPDIYDVRMIFKGTTSGNEIGRIMADDGTHLSIQGGQAGATLPLVLQQSGGNVGIGTTTPSGKLHIYNGASGQSTVEGVADDLIIENSSSAGISILTPNNHSGYLIFGDNDYQSKFNVSYNHSTDKFSLQGKLVIDNASGNIGIGTTSPSKKLVVQTSSSAPAGTPYSNTQFLLTGQSTVGLGLYGDDTSLQQIVFGSASDNTGALITYKQSTALLTFGTAITNGEIGFTSGTGSEKVRIDSTGNVGIGTTSPSDVLHVKGGDIKGIRIESTTNTPILDLYQTGLSHADARNWRIATNNTNYGDISFVVSSANNNAPSSEKVTINKSGNVGIGTTSPDSKLHVNGHLTLANSYRIGVYSPVGTPETSVKFNDAGAGGEYIHFYVNNGLRAELDASGNLQVDGTLSIDGTSDSYIQGNVGIGTTAPDAMLHIDDNVNALVHIDAGPSGATANSSSRLIIEDNTTARLQFLTPSTISAGILFGDPGSSTAGSISYAHASDELTLESSANFRLRIAGQNPLMVDSGGDFNFNAGDVFFDNSTGNVGIGTSTPNARLHVDGGDVRFNDASDNPGFFFDESTGRVGVGTTTPSAKLEVYDGNAVITSTTLVSGGANQAMRLTDAGLRFQRSNGDWGGGSLTFTPNALAGTLNLYARGNVTVGNSSGSGSYVDVPFSGDVKFYTGDGSTGAERMRITNTGNVGIGTTNPNAKLSVVGDIETTGGMITTDEFMQIKPWTGYGTGTSGIWYDGTGGSGSSIGQMEFTVGTLSGSNTKMVIREDGNVGIGTTSPGNTLEISKEANHGITLRRTGVNSGSAKVQVMTLGDLVFDADRNITMRVNGTDTGMSILSTGNVGIGTTAPGAKLQIVDNSGVTTFGNAIGSGWSTAWFGASSPSSTNYALTSSGSHLYVNVPDTSSNFYFRSANSNELVTIKGSGNVGIGTTSPGEKLEIQGGNLLVKDGWISSPDYVTHSSGSGERFGAGATAGFGAVALGKNASAANYSVAIGRDTSAGQYEFVAASGLDIYHRISDVYFGLGKTHASASTAGSYTIHGTGGSGTNIAGGDVTIAGGKGTGNAAGGSVIFSTSDAGSSGATLQTLSEKMRITNTGNVGIGTTGPAQLLHLSSNAPIIRIDDETAYNSSPKSRIDFVGKYNASGSLDGFAMIEGGKENATDGDAKGYLSFKTNTSVSNKEEKMRITSTGNVGIGTTAPGAKLEVSGQSSDGVLKLNGGDDSGGSNGYTQIVFGGPYGSSQYKHFIRTRHNGASATNNAIDFYTSDGTPSGTFPTNAVLGLSINNGNVGIGTTAPGYKLDVNGDMQLRNDAKLYFDGSHGSIQEHGGVMEIEAWNGIVMDSGKIGNSSFQIQNDGSPVVTVNNTGNVGIGTTAPGAKLDVATNALFGSDVSSTETIASSGFDFGSGDVFIADQLGVEGYIYTDLGYFVGGAQMIDSNRNMYNLGGNFRASSGNALNFQTNGTNDSRLYVATTGNVGIGTTAPDSKLHISNGASTPNFVKSFTNSSSVSALRGGYDGDTSNTYRWELSNNSNISFGTGESEGGLSLGINGVDGVIYGLNGGLGFQTNAGNKMVITNTGNVGIGTTAPGAKLEVSGATKITGGVLNLDSGYPIRWGGAASSIYSGSGTSDMVFTAGSSERMRINGNTGNVGIGTTAPKGKLSVKDGLEIAIDSGGTNIMDIKAYEGAGAHTGLRFDYAGTGDDNQLQVYDFSGNAPLVTFKRGGNVGIGTTAPDTNLSIVSSNTTDNQIHLWSQNTGITSGHVVGGIGFVSNDSQLASPTEAASIQAIAMEAHTATQVGTELAFSTTPTHTLTPVERVRIDNTGNVGIGTTSPDTTLHVYKNAASVYATHIENAYSNGGKGLLVSAGSGVVQRLERDGGATGYLETSFPAASLQLNTNSAYKFAIAGSEKVRITSSGNVGIGTASPGAKLHIAQGADYNGLRITGYDDESSDYLDLHVGGIMGRISTNKNYIYTQVAGSYVHRVNTSFFDLYTGLTMQDNKELRLGNDVDFRIQYDGTTDDRLEIADNALNQLLTIKDQGTKADFNFNNGDVFISSTGNVGIGTTSPSQKLSVVGDVSISTLTNVTDLQTNASGVLIDGASDENLKNIQGDYTRGIEDILKINPITYSWKEGLYFRDGEESGFSAQNIQLAIPEAVKTNSRDYLSVSDRPILATVVNALKEVWAGVQENADKITQLFSKDAELEARIAALEAQLAGASASGGSGDAENGSDTPFTPTITILGNNPAEVDLGATYSDLGASAKNPDGNDISITTWIDGVEVHDIDLDTSTSTTYTIEYRAQWEGSVATSTREVIVGSPDAEVEDTEVATSTDPIATSTPDVATSTEPVATTTPEVATSTATTTASSTSSVQATSTDSTD